MEQDRESADDLRLRFVFVPDGQELPAEARVGLADAVHLAARLVLRRAPGAGAAPVLTRLRTQQGG